MVFDVPQQHWQLVEYQGCIWLPKWVWAEKLRNYIWNEHNTEADKV